MIKVNIDVTKMDKPAFHKGKKGIYANLTLIPNKDGRDQYDNDGFVVQELPKQRRDAGEKNPIIGNYREEKPQKQAQIQQPQFDDDCEDIPF